MNDFSNALIELLPSADKSVLLRKAKIVDLNVGDVLCTPVSGSSKIYFPVSGTIAARVVCKTKASVPSLTLNLVGAEGAVGLEAALGFSGSHLQWVVQSPGEAFIFEVSSLQRFLRTRRAVTLEISRYLWKFYDQVAVLASQCYGQSINARLAKWLVLSSQRCAPDPLFLTHEQISLMLGVRRASVTTAATELRRKGYISYNRGHINLLDLPALEALADLTV